MSEILIISIMPMLLIFTLSLHIESSDTPRKKKNKTENVLFSLVEMARQIIKGMLFGIFFFLN